MKKNGHKSERRNKRTKEQKSVNLMHLCTYALPFIASAMMLGIIQTPIELSFFAWIAYVPFLLAVHYFGKQENKPRHLFKIIFVVAAFYWLCVLHWLTPITIAGWFVLCLYTALLWPLLFFCLQFFTKKKVPLFIASAVIIVGIERMQGLFLGGFFWRFLAHSQYKNITIIQIADIFGAADGIGIQAIQGIR